MADEKVDPKRAREIIEMQTEAIRKDIPMMVFADKEDMRQAHENMKLGAAMNGKFIFIPFRPLYLH